MIRQFKNCPFCNGPARAHHIAGYDGSMMSIQCIECGAEIEDVTVDAAEIKWNTRAPISDAVVERMCAAFSAYEWKPEDGPVAYICRMKAALAAMVEGEGK